MLIGIDIVDIDRIRIITLRTPRFLERVFTSNELEYCLKKKNPYPSLAARFAAREAFRKLDSAFLRNINFHDIEVKNDEFGKPFLDVNEKVIKICQDANIKDFSLSLSHSKNHAIAAIIAKKGE